MTRRREISPALLGSVALHALVAAALLISWRFTRELKLGSVVPVTIVSDAPSGELPQAQQAPEAAPAQTEEPQPQAPPQPVPPAPQPAPAPPAPQPAPAKAQPAPTPKPAPKPVKQVDKTPTAKPQAPAKPEKSLDLDALAASLSKMSKPAGGKPSSAAKGPSKAATAPVTGPALSASAQAAALNGLKDAVERRWNPNCDVAGGRDVQVSVFFRIDSTGQVVGDVRSQIRSAQSDVARAGADRAVRAVYAAAPFRSLPRELYGQNFKLNFDAKDACS